MRSSPITANVWALTSRCGITPESAEDQLVEGEIEVRRAAKKLEIRLPILVGLNWDNLFESASPPGALPPKSARHSLTREANRQRWARSRALRSGPRGLIASLRA